MSTTLSVFAFGTQEVRAITDEHGEPWFVLRDVLVAMGRSGDVVRSIEQRLGERHVRIIPAGRMQGVMIISEPAVTYLVAESNTDAGRKLNRFIHTEVLPQIRKTGSHARPKRGQSETAIDYFTVVDYHHFANLPGELPPHKVAEMGREAINYCKAHGIAIGTTPDAHCGMVNTYPEEVLRELFG